MLQVGLNEKMVLTMIHSASSSILFLPFHFNSQDGECSLPHTAVSPPSQLLQYPDRVYIDAEHQADPLGFLPALIYSIVWCTDPVSACGAATSTASDLPQRLGTRPPPNQSLVGFFMADYNSHPFCPIGINQPGGEPLFRELVHNPAVRLLNIRTVLFGDLI